jgi:hypothetical protein
MAEGTATPAEGPDEFLKRLSDELAAKGSVDVDLTKILKEFILDSPAKAEGVAGARKAISELASTRASIEPKADS